MDSLEQAGPGRSPEQQAAAIMLEGPTCPHNPSRPLVLILLTFIAEGSIPETVAKFVFRGIYTPCLWY